MKQEITYNMMENKTDILNDQSEDNKTQYINSERYKYIIFFIFIEIEN